MKNIKIILAFLAGLLILTSGAKNKADKETLQWRYEIEPVVGQAGQGAILLKVWTYSKKKEVAEAQAGKNAVHGVLFKGVSALIDGKNRIPAQKALIADPLVEETHGAFFKEFFQTGGKYQKYVNFINNGVPAPGDVLKIGKEYKIGIIVSVSKDALRKEMEAQGIVKSLGGMF